MSSDRQQIAEAADRFDLSLRLSLYPKQLFIGNVEVRLANDRTLDFYSNKSKRIVMCFSVASNQKMGISPKDISIALTKFEALSTKKGEVEFCPPAMIARMSPSAAGHLIKECGNVHSVLSSQIPPNSHYSEISVLLTVIFRDDVSKENEKSNGLEDDVFMRAVMGPPNQKLQFHFDADDAFDIINHDILKMWNACLTDRWKRRSVVHDNKTSSLITPLQSYEWASFLASLHLHMKMIDNGDFRYIYINGCRNPQKPRVMTLEKIDLARGIKRPPVMSHAAFGHVQCCGSVRLDDKSYDTKYSIRCLNERTVVVLASSQFLEKKRIEAERINSLPSEKKRKIEECEKNEEPVKIVDCKKEDIREEQENIPDSAEELTGIVQHLTMNEAVGEESSNIEERNGKNAIGGGETVEPMDVSIDVVGDRSADANGMGDQGQGHDEAEPQNDENVEAVMKAQEEFLKDLEGFEWSPEKEQAEVQEKVGGMDQGDRVQPAEPTNQTDGVDDLTHQMEQMEQMDQMDQMNQANINHYPNPYIPVASTSGHMPYPYPVEMTTQSANYYNQNNQSLFYSQPFTPFVDTSEIDSYFVQNRLPTQQEQSNLKKQRIDGPLQKAVFNGQKTPPPVANQQIAAGAQLSKKKKSNVETLEDDDMETAEDASQDTNEESMDEQRGEAEKDEAAGISFDEKLFVYPPKDFNTDVEPTTVTIKDAITLGPAEFLNDSILQFKMIHTQCHMDPALKARCHFFNTFFYSGLVKTLPPTSTGKKDFVMTKNTLTQLGKNSERIVKWTKKFDLFLKDYVVIPINEDFHWLLIIVVNPKGAIVEKENEEESRKKPKTYLMFFDPLNGLDPNRNLYMSFYLQKYFMTLYNKTKTPNGKFPTPTETFFDPLRIETVIPKNLPIQRNYLDCGAFVLYFIDTLFMDKNPLTVEEVPGFDWEERYEMSRERADVMRHKVYHMVAARTPQHMRSRLEKFENKIKRGMTLDPHRARRHHSSGLPRRLKRNPKYHSRCYSLDPPVSGVMDKTICGNPRQLMEMECTHKVRKYVPLGDKCLEYLKD